MALSCVGAPPTSYENNVVSQLPHPHPTAHALAAFHTALLLGDTEADAIDKALKAELLDCREKCRYWIERREELARLGLAPTILTTPIDPL
jgi:hypothetical protein